VEGVDEPSAPARGRRADHRVHVVWTGGHGGLGHGADQAAEVGESRGAVYTGAQAAQGGAGVSAAGGRVFASADQLDEVSNPDGVRVQRIVLELRICRL